MSFGVVIGLSIVCAVPRAHAERAITVDVAAAAPFDADELRRAMRVRLAPDGTPVRVRVTVTATGLQVAADDRVREVDIAGLHGTAAARLVALAASDLLLEDLATVPEMSKPRRSMTIGAIGGIAGWERLVGGAAIDVTVPIGRGLFAADLGASTLTGGELSLTAATARIGGGVRVGLLELRAGLTLAPVFVSDGSGDRTVLVGAGASVRLRVPVSPRARGVFALGADAFATQTEYRSAGMTVMTTPRVAPWTGAGIEVTP